MEIMELKKIFNSKKYHFAKNRLIKNVLGFREKQFDDFLIWFNVSDFDKGCYYCGTSNNKCAELFRLRPEATRGGKRGRRLELDRKDPFLSYDNFDNLVWCCYWCNNSKSNFFTEMEFKSISLAIGNVLRSINTKND